MVLTCLGVGHRNDAVELRVTWDEVIIRTGNRCGPGQQVLTVCDRRYHDAVAFHNVVRQHDVDLVVPDPCAGREVAGTDNDFVVGLRAASGYGDP